MKKEITKSPKNKAIQKEEDRWIDVHDDNVMREMGFDRPLNQAPRDKSVWSKTPNERRLLRNVRHSIKGDMHFHSTPPKRAMVCAKLIVQLKSNDAFPKSTYSQECLNTHIGAVLGKFRVTDPKTGCSESVVAKYSYNGITYAPNETPYCG